MKITLLSVVLYIVFNSLGALAFQWAKDVPNWSIAGYIILANITNILFFCALVKLSEGLE